MDYPIKPIQKIVFLNNKGGVGKTTLSFNVACKMADMGHKVLLVDADPQCNLTLLAL
jgi:cellulose biosynthesis protein BcsQ